MSDILMTPDGLERLNDELERLRLEHEALATRITRALVDGGAAPENGEYMDARREQELLEHRITRLEDRLLAASVVAPELDGEVDVGERVTVRDLVTGATFDYRIVGSGEADPARGDVSHGSPVGFALLGRRVGDVVEVEAPAGRVRLEVVDVAG